MLSPRIENPADKESVVFVVSGHETNGEFLRYEVRFRAGGAGAHAHAHPTQEQRIEVQQGRMGFRVGSISGTYGPGEIIVVPPNTPHFQWNAGDEELICVQEQRPAGRMEEFLRIVFGLVRDQRMTTLQAAAVLGEYSDCTRHVGWRRPVFSVLALVAKARGYKGRHDEYCQPS